MIAIFGTQYDLCARQTYEYLLQRGRKVVFIDLASDWLGTVGINWFLECPDNRGFLSVNSHEITLADITSVLARTLYPSYADSQLTQKDQDYIRSESHAMLLGLLGFLDCRVINRPRAGVGRNPIFANREQLKEVVQSGFELPKTLVTANYERALSFYESCGQIAILGSQSHPNGPQLIKGEEGLVQLQELLEQQPPIYLQEVLPGEWFQAFVAGSKVFGASFWFNSPAGGKQMLPFPEAKLSPELQERCYKLARTLKLDFLQLRWLQTEANQAYCFDVSEFPTYFQCEKPLQEKITTALADLLQKGDAED